MDEVVHVRQTKGSLSRHQNHGAAMGTKSSPTPLTIVHLLYLTWRTVCFRWCSLIH